MNAPKPRFGKSLKPFRRPMLWAGFWMLGVAVVVVGSLMPASNLPHVPNNFDKVEHLISYTALSAGAVQLFARRLSWGFVCVLLVLMGIGLEHLQAQMALGRQLDRSDVLANAIGVLIGLATAFTPWRDALLRFDRRFDRRS